VSISIGVIIYLTILISLLITALMKCQEPYYPLFPALTLIPLIRIISVSLPLTGLTEAFGIVVVSVPLFITGVMVAKIVSITPTAMGFKICILHKQLLIALSGLPLGFIKFYIIQPDIKNISIAPVEILMWVIALIICVGLLEEFLFRGILFNVANKFLGYNKAMYFTSLLYAALTISSKSLLNVIYAFFISILFCRIFIWKESIVGISLAHGIINITFYLICPLIFY
jgi:membrane protease YdiL (CAAX protease family)